MAMLQALHDAFDTIAADDTIRVVILARRRPGLFARPSHL